MGCGASSVPDVSVPNPAAQAPEAKPAPAPAPAAAAPVAKAPQPKNVEPPKPTPAPAPAQAAASSSAPTPTSSSTGPPAVAAGPAVVEDAQPNKNDEPAAAAPVEEEEEEEEVAVAAKQDEQEARDAQALAATRIQAVMRGRKARAEVTQLRINSEKKELEDAHVNPEKVIAGMLQKKGERGSRWASRYAVLDGGVFSYFRSEEDYENLTKPNKGRYVPIDKYRVMVGPDEDLRSFQLVPISDKPGDGVAADKSGKPRVFLLRSQYPEERDMWVDAFRTEGALGPKEEEEAKDAPAAASAAAAAVEAGPEAAAAPVAPPSEEKAAAAPEEEAAAEPAEEAEEEKKEGGDEEAAAGAGEAGAAAAAAGGSDAPKKTASFAQPMRGYLDKQPPNTSMLLRGMSWRRRFCSLEDGKFVYYADQGNFEAGKPKRDQEVTVSDYVVAARPTSAAEPLVLRLKPVDPNNGPREWQLRAKDAEERARWVVAFRTHGAVKPEDDDEDPVLEDGGSGDEGLKIKPSKVTTSGVDEEAEEEAAKAAEETAAAAAEEEAEEEEEEAVKVVVEEGEAGAAADANA